MDIKTAGVSIPAAGAKALSPHTFQSTPLLSKQGTPEASPDTQEPEPPERVAHVPAGEGLRTKGRRSPPQSGRPIRQTYGGQALVNTFDSGAGRPSPLHGKNGGPYFESQPSQARLGHPSSDGPQNPGDSKHMK